MRIIPTKVHGMLDYVSGVVFLISPWIFGFVTDNAAEWIPIIMGVLILLYSAFTNYELGLSRRLPMPLHLTFDVVGGIFLAVSPWLFGFADRVFWPHLIFGLFSLGAGLLTSRTPQHGTVSA